ncbi:MAG: GAF domain-containing protein [Candidatus Zixiibacteriota bacterium]
MMATIEDPVAAGEVGSEVQNSFRRYFEASRVGLFVIDRDAKLSYVNERAAEIFGFAHSGNIGQTEISQLDFFFSQSVVERIAGLLRFDESFKIDRMPGTNLAGHFAYYCLACHPMHDSNGRVSGVMGIIEDFTEQEKINRELKRTVDELSILSQISQVVSSALDTEQILEVILTAVTARQGLGFNRAFLFLLDEAGEYLTGKLAVGPANAEEAGHIWSTLANDDRSLLETLSKYLRQTGNTQSNLFSLIEGQRIDISNGSLFARCIREKQPMVIDDQTVLDPVTERIFGRLGEKHAAMTPLISLDRPIGLLIVDNAITREQITEQDCRFLKLIADQSASAVERSYLYRDIRDRALELEAMNVRLAEIQNQIIQAEKMSVIGEITSAVAHELRNPLTIIGGFANLVCKNCAPGSPEAEYLNIIISETQRAESVLTDVMDFSKASKTADRRLDFNGLVGEAVEMMAMRMGNGKKRLNVKLSDVPLFVWGNSEQLRHAVYQVILTILHDLDANMQPHVQTFMLADMVRLEIHFLDGRQKMQSLEKALGQYFGPGCSSKRLSLLVAEEALKHHGGNLGIESGIKEGPILYIELPLRREEGDG